MTVEELQALMPAVFTSNELNSIGWSDYTTEDLNAILERSEGFIDNLIYKGKYKERNQLHSFPRVLHSGLEISIKDERVLKSICCVVFDDIKSMQSSSRTDLIRQGVKSISTAGVSESYSSYEEIESNKISDNYVKYLGFCLLGDTL